MAETGRPSSTGRAQARRATPRPQHGNTTQNNAINLAKEQADQVREREAELGMTSVLPPEEMIEEYSDAALMAADEAAWEESQQVEDIDLGGLVIQALPRERPRRLMRSVTDNGDVDLDELVEVRFNDTYPEVTLGKDPVTEIIRMHTFEGNRRYRLPRWMAEHLADKEMLIS